MRSIREGACLLLFFISSVAQSAEFSLFGSTVFARGDNEHAQNFLIGDLELVTEQNISDTSYVALNLLVESDQHSHFETEIERFVIHKSLTDDFDIAVGRFLEPLGLWNFDFSHGSLTQHTVNRPYIFELEEEEKGILPTHLVGMLFSYDADFITLQIALANSNGMDTSEPDIELTTLSSTPNKDITSTIRFAIHPSPQFQFSLTGIRNNVIELGMMNSGALPHSEILFEQSIYGFDFRYRATCFYIFGEYYRVDVTDNLDAVAINPQLDTYKADTYYVQLGYKLSTTLTIVARYESLEIDDIAPFFDEQDLESLTRSVAGVNFKFDESNALRFEWSRTKPDVGEAEANYYLQWFFYLL